MAMPITPAEGIAEFIGTFLLVFTVGCNVLTGSPVWAGVSIGCVLMVMIYALGGVSGANFNPAVSIALGLSNKMEGGWPKVGAYCAVQIVAGLCAGFTYSALFMNVIPLAPAPGFGWLEAMLAEVLYTFMLCFVVLNAACSKRNGCGNENNQFFGLAIGFVIIAGAYGAGAISGGCFNPAVAFGIDISSAFLGVKWCFIYTIYEIIGAALAAGLFRVVRPEDFDGEAKTDSAKLVSEFLGTYILVLTVGLNVLASSPAAAFSIAASLTCMIYALGDVSGANFNPAVTVAILCSGRDQMDAQTAGKYVAVQLLGGIAAAFTYSLMRRGETFPLGPGAGYNYAQAGLAEIVFTFVLCFVVLCVAVRMDDKDNLKNTFGLVIGSCVTVGGFAIGGVSGGSLNPAVSVGISSAHILNHGVFYNCLLYSVFELIGGALAAGVYSVTFPLEYPKGSVLVK